MKYKWPNLAAEANLFARPHRQKHAAWALMTSSNLNVLFCAYTAFSGTRPPCFDQIFIVLAHHDAPRLNICTFRGKRVVNATMIKCNGQRIFETKARDIRGKKNSTKRLNRDSLHSWSNLDSIGAAFTKKLLYLIRRRRRKCQNKQLKQVRLC